MRRGGAHVGESGRGRQRTTVIHEVLGRDGTQRSRGEGTEIRLKVERVEVKGRAQASGEASRGKPKELNLVI